jgi:hypothetical protein
MWLSSNSLLSAPQPAPKAVPTTPRLGEFDLRDFDNMRLDYNTKTGAASVRLIKPVLTSPRYDFSGGSISLTIQNGRAQNGIASGNVHVVVRDQAYDEATKQIINKQTIQVDCDRAEYVAGKEQGQGRIDLSGNIVSKIYSPLSEGPSVLTGQTGTINLLGKSGTSFSINKGTAKTTPREPAPAKK